MARATLPTLPAILSRLGSTGYILEVNIPPDIILVMATLISWLGVMKNTIFYVVRFQ